MTRAAGCAVLALLALTPAGVRSEQQPRGVTVSTEPSGGRLALVIGNDAYSSAPLKNAVTDAKAMATSLRTYGFEVDLATDVSFKDLSKSVDRFIARLKPGDVAMLFYAGHGFQVDNENYLVPVDFAAKDEADAKYEGYSASRIVDRMAASGARLTIAVFDACRNNPFRSTRAVGGGLAPMLSATGTFIAFATAPNRTADDNPRAGHGLFTGFLLDVMNEPDVGIEQVFSRVRQMVYDASDKRQVPWVISSVIGDFAFRTTRPAPPAPAVPATAIASVTPSATPYVATGDAAVHLYTVQAASARAFERFVPGFKQAIQAGASPSRARQAVGWKIYKSTDPVAGGNVLYWFVMDPAIRGADYSVGHVLVDIAPATSSALFAQFAEGAVSANVLNLERRGALGMPSAVETLTAPALPALRAKDISFTSDAGLMLWSIRPDKVQDFDAVLEKARQVLGSHPSALRRRQGATWKIYRMLEPMTEGNVAYVFVVDPAMKGISYDFGQIFSEVLSTAETQALYRQYSGAMVDLHVINLKELADLGVPR